VALYDALAVKNDLATGRELWKKIWPICDFLESVNYYAGSKAGCELIGAPVGPVRAPGLPLSGEQKAHFAKLLAAAGVKTV
jgi:dihydrodipicolinate synthase/N-acetylneuraminate lyase